MISLRFILATLLSGMLLISNPIVLDYDELIGSDQVPHHELIRTGWPMAAQTYWTTCTTFGYPEPNFIIGGILVDAFFAFSLVYGLDHIIDKLSDKEKKQNGS